MKYFNLFQLSISELPGAHSEEASWSDREETPRQDQQQSDRAAQAGANCLRKTGQ